MPDPQQMLPRPVTEWLVAFIEQQTGVTNPTDIRFVWMGHGEGVVTFRDQPGGDAWRAITRLKIEGADADMLREVETGKEPLTRSEPWEDGERPVGWGRR